MLPENIKKALRFYFITDDSAPNLSPLKQVETAIEAGATFIQYRNKSFSSEAFGEAQAIRDLCKCNGVSFVVNDNVLLGKAVDADGVHLGQEDETPAMARQILGEHAIIGISVSNIEELSKTDLSACDYIGTGPVFPTRTKKDAKDAIGPEGLKTVINEVSLPVVAIGAIDSSNASLCFDAGACGVSVISCISRAKNPMKSALELGKVCGCPPRSSVMKPWDNEFGLIEKLLKYTPEESHIGTSPIKIAPGDDACLLNPVARPVITTDTQKAGVHFVLDWQTPREVGYKAVSITLSDLAASYATPVSLFINLGLPKHISDETVEALYGGIREALIRYGCALGGGNISRAAQLSIDLFAIGQGKEDLFPTRAAAISGEGLYCTGALGRARAGLQCLREKDTTFQKLIDRFKFPTARFDAANILAEHGIQCVMDISDGLAGDARHIAEASRLSVEFDLKPDDFDSELLSFCQKYGLSPEAVILEGGEDYELLFTCSPAIFKAVKNKLPVAFQVGRCLPFNGKHLVNLPKGLASFQHGYGKS